MAAVGGVIVVTSLAGIVGVLGWIARRARRRGTAGAALAGAMAAYDQAWHVTAYDAHVEIQARAARVASSESPVDL